MMRLIVLSLVISATLSGSAFAADGHSLFDAFNRIYTSRVDTVLSYDLSDAVLTHKDFTLNLDSGSMHFVEPISLGDSQIVYAAYFRGRGEYRIAPTEMRARKQIEREFDDEAIAMSIERALLIFTPDIYEQLWVHCQPGNQKLDSMEQVRYRNSWERFGKKENYYFAFEALRNIREPSDQSFLCVNLQEHTLSQSEYYLFNPLDAEEIKIYKNKITGPMFGQFMRTLCSYSCLLDSTGRKCRVVSEPQIKTLHNDLTVEISDGGSMTAVAAGTYEVLKPPAQLLWMVLHENMTVDSIVDGRGERVHFVRYEDADNKSYNLYLFLNGPAQVGDTLALTYYYRGRIIEFSGRDIINQSGSVWYPAYIERDAATFDIAYDIPYYKDLVFESTGTRQSETIDGHRCNSTWTVTEPEMYIFFDYAEK